MSEEHRPGAGVESPAPEPPAQKRPRGRPSVWTPEVERRILGAVTQGLYLETAAALAGIDKSTLHRRLKAGRRKGAKAADRDFCTSIEKALAASEARDLAVISKAAAEGQWPAAAWRLERKFPDRWGKRDTVTVLQRLARNVEQMSDDELLQEAGLAAVGVRSGDEDPEAPGAR